jgi:hypothetical protein
LLSEICCPTLILCGREDAWIPVAQHEEIASKISGSKVEIIEWCGHVAPVEHPGEVTAALKKCFAELQAAEGTHYLPRISFSTALEAGSGASRSEKCPARCRTIGS